MRHSKNRTQQRRQMLPAEAGAENKSRTPVLKKEEEQLFQEVMTEFLGG